jgi:predicted enzyme related to lactoylglutathione lyase
VAVDERNMPKEAGAINGGITMRSKKGETPVLVIDVPSVDAYLKKIAKRGGRVVQPKQNVMDMGLYARVTDTEGNVIGIWEDIRK